VLPSCPVADAVWGASTGEMLESQGRLLKFIYFVLGIALPVAGYVIWSRTDGFRITKKSRVDRAHDTTVEDSFPASDPPSAW
jgi:hypothetical protein